MYQVYSPIVRPPLAAKSYRNKNTQQFFSEVLSYGRKDVWRFFSRETFWYTGLLVAAIKRCGFFLCWLVRVKLCRIFFVMVYVVLSVHSAIINRSKMLFYKTKNKYTDEINAN